MENPTTPSPAGWYPDPSGRHEYRYYDGTAWTAHVSDQGNVSQDDPGAPTPPAASYSASGAPAPWSGGPSSLPPVLAGSERTFGGAPLATFGQRLGGAFLEVALLFVTLFIGWLAWACFTFSKGQTPAKSLLGLRVVKAGTGVAASWGTMFVRNVVVGLALGLISSELAGIPGIVAALMIFSGDMRQTGWDRLVGTVVVHDKGGITLPPNR